MKNRKYYTAESQNLINKSLKEATPIPATHTYMTIHTYMTTHNMHDNTHIHDNAHIHDNTHLHDNTHIHDRSLSSFGIKKWRC